MEKISKSFIVSIQTPDITDDLIELIKNYKVLGVVISEKNFDDIISLHNFISKIKELADYNIIIGIDYFSIDSNNKIFDNILKLPSLASIAATNKEDYIRRHAEILSRIYKSIGINMDFSLNASFDHFNYLNTMGISSEISKYLAFYIQTLQENGILTTIKNFPGRLEEDIYNIFSSENLEIYKKLINSNIDIIFLSNNIYANIDKIPASISQKFVHMLKNNLNYIGLIGAYISDVQLLGEYKLEYLIYNGLKNGVNVLYIDRNIEKLPEIINNLYKYEEITKTIEDNYNKIEFLLKKLEVFYSQSPIEELEQTIFQQYIDQMAEEAIYVYEKKKFFPIKAKEFDIIGVVEPSKLLKEFMTQEEYSDIFTFTKYLKNYHKYIYQIVPDENTKWHEYSYIIYLIDSADNKTKNYLKTINKLDIPLIMIFVDDPQILNYYKDIDGVKIISFGFDESQRMAISKVIFGKYENQKVKNFVI